MKKKIFVLILNLFLIITSCIPQNEKTLDTLKKAVIPYNEKGLTIAEETNILAGKNGTVEYFLPKKEYNNKDLIAFGFTVTHPQYGKCTMIFSIDKTTNKVLGFPEKTDINGQTFSYDAFGLPDNTQAWQELLEWELRGALEKN